MFPFAAPTDGSARVSPRVYMENFVCCATVRGATENRLHARSFVVLATPRSGAPTSPGFVLPEISRSLLVNGGKRIGGCSFFETV